MDRSLPSRLRHRRTPAAMVAHTRGHPTVHLSKISAPQSATRGNRPRKSQTESFGRNRASTCVARGEGSLTPSAAVSSNCVQDFLIHFVSHTLSTGLGTLGEGRVAFLRQQRGLQVDGPRWRNGKERAAEASSAAAGGTGRLDGAEEVVWRDFHGRLGGAAGRVFGFRSRKRKNWPQTRRGRRAQMEVGGRGWRGLG